MTLPHETDWINEMDNETKILSLEMENQALRECLYSACGLIGQKKIEYNKMVKLSDIQLENLRKHQNDCKRLNQENEYLNGLIDSHIYSFNKVFDLIQQKGFSGFHISPKNLNFYLIKNGDGRLIRFTSLDKMVKYLESKQ